MTSVTMQNITHAVHGYLVEQYVPCFYGTHMLNHRIQKRLQLKRILRHFISIALPRSHFHAIRVLIPHTKVSECGIFA